MNAFLATPGIGNHPFIFICGLCQVWLLPTVPPRRWRICPAFLVAAAPAPGTTPGLRQVPNKATGMDRTQFPQTLCPRRGVPTAAPRRAAGRPGSLGDTGARGLEFRPSGPPAACALEPASPSRSVGCLICKTEDSSREKAAQGERAAFPGASPPRPAEVTVPWPSSRVPLAPPSRAAGPERAAPEPRSSRSPPHPQPTYERGRPPTLSHGHLAAGRRHVAQRASGSRAARETANQERGFREVPPRREEHQ